MTLESEPTVAVLTLHEDKLDMLTLLGPFVKMDDSTLFGNGIFLKRACEYISCNTGFTKQPVGLARNLVSIFFPKVEFCTAGKPAMLCCLGGAPSPSSCCLVYSSNTFLKFSGRRQTVGEEIKVSVTDGSGAAIVEGGDPTPEVVDLGASQHRSVGDTETLEMGGALCDEELVTTAGTAA